MRIDKMRIEKKPGCIKATAHILGDKWTPLLVHALATSPLRFCELQKAASNINPRTLSARLVWLEQNKIITKAIRSNNPPYTEYALTQKGTDLIPILINMADWGEKYGSAIVPKQTAGSPRGEPIDKTFTSYA